MSETTWLNAEEARAWRALQNLNMPLAAVLNRQLTRQSNLSTADYAVLVQLSESPEKRMRARDLVIATGWEKSRLSHHIRRMENRQLVARQECPTDGRGAFIALTPVGQTTIEQAAPHHVQTVRSYVIDLLTPEQLRVLAEIGETVGARLAAECSAVEADEPCFGQRSDRPDVDGTVGCQPNGATPAGPAGCDNASMDEDRSKERAERTAMSARAKGRRA